MKSDHSGQSPPDRSHVLTEQRNPRTMNLHELSVAECVTLLGDEDKAVLTALKLARASLTEFIKAVEPRFIAGGRLIYIGAGTSGRLGVLDASEAPPTFQLPPDRIVGIIAGGDRSLRKSSEGLEDNPDGARSALVDLKLVENDTVLGIATGGTTPYVLGASRIVKDLMPKVLTGLLVCSDITKPETVDYMISILTGSEVLTGSTRMKAGTATKLALNTISTTLMIRSGRVYENLMVDLKATNDKLRDRAGRIISTLTDLNRSQSLNLLDLAGGEVKTAVVMKRLDVSALEAEKLLSENGGRLDRVIG